MSGSLDEPLAKLKRAAQHYRLLKDELHGGLDSHMHAVRVEPRHEGLEYVFYIGEVEPLDPAWPFVVGDCVHNIRASLDYLVFQLHIRRYKGKVPADAEEAAQFPIRLREPRYKGGPRRGAIVPAQEWPGIMRLALPQRRSIRWMQPYIQRKDSLSPFRQTLADIHQLDIADKHRHVHVVSAVLRQVPTLSPGPYGFKQRPAFRIPLESNMPVDHWTFVEPPPSEYIETYTHVETTVGLEYGGQWYELLANLGGTLHVVAAIINSFARLFPPASEQLDLSWVHRWDPPSLR